jgi:SOS response regulatory protein OraA/RecX
MTTRWPTYAERRARADARRAERADIQDPAVVLEAAAAFLAVRPRSVDETRRRLGHLGYAAAPIEIVLDRLLAFGYLDDEVFARTWVESRDRAHPRGESALRRELARKGIDREIIAAVLAEREAAVDAHDPDSAARPTSGLPATGESAEPADEMAARRLIGRRAGSLAREPDPRRRRQKAYALLARNGFAPDVCARVSELAAAGTDPVAGTPDER